MKLKTHSVQEQTSKFAAHHSAVLRFVRISAVLSLFLLGYSADVAAETPRLRIAMANTDLPGAGIRFKGLEGADSRPMKPPENRTYTYTRGDEKWTVEKINIRELWMSRQQVGRWVDKYGNALSIAEIGLQVPVVEDEDGYVPAKESSDLLKPSAGSQWDTQSLQEWAELYAGARSLSPAKTLGATAQLGDVVQMNLPDRTIGYAFRFSKPADATSRWFFAMFVLDARAGKDESVMVIQEKFLKSISWIKQGAGQGRGAVSGQAQAQRRFQDPRQAGMTNRSPEFLASRQKVIDSIKNMDGWWYVETRNYVVMSNLGARDKEFVRRLQSDIELFRPVFERLVPPARPIEEVSVVRVFNTDEQYLEYVPESFRWSGGMWMPSREELIVRPCVNWSGNKSGERMLRTVYHEAFHQFQHYALDRAQSATWFNEGMSELVEGGTVRGRRIEIGESEASSGDVSLLVRNGALNFAALVKLEPDEFYRAEDGNSAARGMNYSRSWALIYYLTRGAVREKVNPYADVLAKYRTALLETRDWKAATDRAFEGVDFDKLESDFAEFWTSSSRRSAALRVDI